MSHAKMRVGMKKIIYTSTILLLLVLSFNNCTQSVKPPTSSTSGNLLFDAHNDGGTTVGSEKTNVNFNSYNPTPNVEIGALKDVRMCVYKIKLWYTALYEPVILDGTIVHNAQKKFISYPIRREVQVAPSGTLISQIRLFAGHYTQVEIYNQAADQSYEPNADCKYRKTPMYVLNSYGALDNVDVTYYAIGYNLNSEIRPETGITIPFQPMANALQRLKSNAELEDFMLNGAPEIGWTYYWPQNYND